jgi:hypothetical protein
MRLISHPGPSSFLANSLHCPDCGAALERVHRHLPDRWISVFRSVHRYRCTSETCDWAGLLGRDGQPPPALIGWPSRLLWLGVGASCTLAAVPLVPPLRVWLVGAPAQAHVEAGVELRSRATPAGVDFAGAALPPTDARALANATPLSLKRGCAWGVPGGSPYRGTVEQALLAAGLPADAVRALGEMAERGWSQGQVEISRSGIRTLDGRRHFDPDITAMGFGHTLCFNTRVNFKPGHVEYAALYEHTDSRYRTYTVMVPYVCRNVSVLGQRGEREIPETEVAEPASWSLVLTGLGLALATSGLWRLRHAETRRP